MITVGKKYTIRDIRDACEALRNDWPDCVEEDEDGYTEEERYFFSSKKLTIRSVEDRDIEEVYISFLNDNGGSYKNLYKKAWVEDWLDEVSDYVQEEMEL